MGFQGDSNMQDLVAAKRWMNFLLNLLVITTKDCGGGEGLG